MSRHLYFRDVGLGDIEGIVEIDQGGTGADNALDAVKNLGGLHKSRGNIPGGVAMLDENGNLPATMYPAELTDLVTLIGPKEVDAGSTVPYQISNYDSFKTYTLSANITRDKDIITYTAPDTGTTDSFSVNAKIANIIIRGVTPEVTYSVDKPTISLEDAN